MDECIRVPVCASVRIRVKLHNYSNWECVLSVIIESVVSHSREDLQAKAEDIALKYPRQVDVHTLKKETNASARLQLIRNMAIPIPAKNILREYWQLNEIKIERNIWQQREALLKSTRQQVEELKNLFELWSRSLKIIEGRFGSGVASYFKFLRWLFIVNSITFAIPFAFLILPVMWNPVHPYDSALTRNIRWEREREIDKKRIAIVEKCSVKYINHTWSTLYPTDILQGTGWLEQSALFYGHYENKQLGTNENQLYNLPMAYLTILFTYFLCTLLFIMHRLSLSEEVKGGEGGAYSQIVFVQWNYSQNEVECVNLQHQSIYADIIVRLEEDRDKIRRRALSDRQRTTLLLTRVAVNVAIGILMVGVVALVYFVTHGASQRLTQKKLDSTLVVLMYQYLPSLTITMVNFIVPKIFGNMAPLEQYKADTQLAVILAR
ncbi:hypothetical protein NP493_69g00001 [Ridgeia piscesae]|uniref:Uncharacterized protein n=1 Tax=Ridgeia piscesae TaxID=27915 RepID=A0AAD9P9Q5_RIDPI|nr:hypothetical protein NP493_69g00001 [Ridgeia piscesae]